MNVVYVTVPAGVLPGQTLSVQLPDGLTMTVVVPNGMTTGSIFGVQAPQYSPNPYRESEKQVTRDPAPPSPVASPVASPVQKRLLVRVPWGTPPGAKVSVEIPDEPWRTITAQVPPNVTEFYVAYTPTTTYPEAYAEPVKEAWEERPVYVPQLWQEAHHHQEHQYQPPTLLNTPKQQSLPVAEPVNDHHQPNPQTKSNSLAHMDVGEAAKALSTAAMQKFNSLKSGVENSSSATVKPQQSLGNDPSPPAPPSKRLLLVRVPPGTPAGSTLRVEVPDKPGVAIEVKVPPNVTEFHVAYMENNAGLSGSTNCVNSDKPSQQQQQIPPMAQTQVPQNLQQKPVAPQQQQQKPVAPQQQQQKPVAPQQQKQKPVAPQQQQQQQQQPVVQEVSQEVLRLQQELKALKDQELERLRQERQKQNQQYVNAGLQIGVAFSKAAIKSYFGASN